MARDPVRTRAAADAADAAPLWPRGAPFGLPALFQALVPFPLPAPMDVTETGGAYEIAMEARGLAPGDITVNEWRRTVTVTARRDGAAPLERRFALPANADEGAATAVLEGGVLTLTFPKKPLGVAAVAAARRDGAVPVGVHAPACCGAAAAAAPAAGAAEPAAAAVAPAPAPAARAAAAVPGDHLAHAVRLGEVAVKRDGDAVTFSFKK